MIKELKIAKDVNTKIYLIEIKELFKILKLPKDEALADICLSHGTATIRITTEKYM